MMWSGMLGVLLLLFTFEIFFLHREPWSGVRLETRNACVVPSHTL
jgi:hypothetical protein